jgi:hypothetical protein
LRNHAPDIVVVVPTIGFDLLYAFVVLRRLYAGLINPACAVQPAPTAEHQHREGLSFWQAIKTMFK